MPRDAESDPQGDDTVRTVPVATLQRLLALAAIVEAGTGLALMIGPAIVAALLLGEDLPGAGAVLGRCFGIGLVALGVACWPGRQRAGSGGAALRAMLTYNVMIALYLAYLGASRQLTGVLLWPGVGLHAVVALALMWTWRVGRRNGSAQPGPARLREAR